MPAKKKAKKKTTKRAIKAAKKSAKKSTKRKPVTKKATSKTKKKAAPKRKTVARRATPRRDRIARVRFIRERSSSDEAGQSGSLQGLPRKPEADSESVDELVEEGNAFEAGIVSGVEEADGVREVHTHEVPEDDVPEEYLNDDNNDVDR